MKRTWIKPLIILAILVIAAYLILRQVFKLMEISLTDMPVYKYLGKQKKSSWYNYLAPYAKAVGAQYGIPWQAILVQTALETTWGTSSLLTKYNNFGGIKAVGGQSSMTAGTKEFVNGQWITISSKFRVWKTPYLGLVGYAKFFHDNKRYAAALNHPNDPYRFIEEIKKAGYATAPNYVSILHGMLKNDLKVKRS